MSTATAPGVAPAASTAGADPRRWLALGFIAIAQLMIVVDASIVNIALPSAQHALHISNANRQWVVTAYTLAFGSLLLLGGRIADYRGRKRMFLVGLVGFAAASAFGGLAPSAPVLFAARGLQGAFAALMAPAALSLISVTFTDARERAKAFGVYGAIAGGGAAIGLILGGVLTQYASWRWCLLVNAPIAAFAAFGAVRVVGESKAPSVGRYDTPGAVTSTLGLLTLVYAMARADTSGWSSVSVLALIASSAALLVGFVVIEARSDNPLLPLRVVLDRNRGGALITSLLSGAGLFGMFLFLAYYLQGTLHYSALKSGFAFLPFSAGIVISAMAASVLLPRLGAKVLMPLGLAMATAGLIWFTQIGPASGFVTHVLPPEIVMSLGMGLVFVPLTATVLIGISDTDAGVASALVNTTQQIGGSIGTALLNTIATTATAGYLVTRGPRAIAAGVVHGYSVAFVVAAALMIAALVATVALVRAGREEAGSVDPALLVA